MEPTFTFRHLDATDGIKDHTRDKLDKLGKYLLKPISAHVVFTVERFTHVAEITLSANGHRYVGIGESNDMYPSIDEAVENILKQLKKDRDRVKNHHKGE
ncbi:MAG: ribosome-associated translation inhibitor RaiA [Deltaproteobacteria bacterium]|nr:ribosome-associated translation inhibitor RaiA [Deltaproteobacteria bacterium]